MSNAPLKPLKRRWELYFPILLTLIDLLTITAGLGAAYWIRFNLIPHLRIRLPYTEGHLFSDYMKMLPVALLIYLASFMFVHMYRTGDKPWSSRVFNRLIRATGLGTSLVVCFLFFFRNFTVNPVSRWIIPVSMVTVPVFVTFGRHTLYRQMVHMAQRRGENLSRALVIGVGYTARQVARSIRRHHEMGMKIVGFISAEAEDIGRDQIGLPVLGATEDLPEILEREKIESVFIAEPDFRRELLGDIFIECQKRMIEVKIVPDITEILFSQVNIEEMDGIPFMGLRGTPLQGWNIILKRVFDIVFASVLLILFSPLILLVALLIKLDSSGSVFYRQVRIGADGRRFLLIKFRTMKDDAEKESGPVFSTPNDPRQTRVGRILRQTHLDELPQLLNVLRGTMSIVGPRPERPVFVDHFREEIPHYMARHRIKSGITGWAQVKGQVGFEGTIAERLKYDLYYIENWSILFDLKVILLTLVWLYRRLHQLITLPPDHPSLRQTRGIIPLEEMAIHADEDDSRKDRDKKSAQGVSVPKPDIKTH